MDDNIEDKLARTQVIQSIFILTLIIAFVVGGIILFKDKNKQTIDIETHGEYSVELIAVGSPAWPFGGHKGYVTLNDDSGKVISKVDVYVNNDGCSMDENNWSVIWEPDKVIVSVGGYEDKTSEKYYLYFDGRIE